MALPKITTADVQNCYVQGQPDKLTGTAQQNKAVFDALPQMIVGKHNDIIDTLNSTDDGDSGADNLGATEIKPGGAQTVQGILDDLGDRVDDADRITALLATIQSIGPVQNDDTVLPTAKDVLEAMAAAGLGDMLKAYYDPNNNGDKVAKSEDADALGGIPAADYMQYADLDAEPTEDSTTAATSGGTKAYIDRHNVNRNLLHNPYFKIDQREGYIIPSGTVYYSDSGLTMQVGTTSADCNGMAGNGTYGMVNVSNTWYYCAWSSSFVRGYVAGTIRTLDRWSAYGSGHTGIYNFVNGVKIPPCADYGQVHTNETLDNPKASKMTVSVIIDDNLYSFTFDWFNDGNQHSSISPMLIDNIHLHIIENWGTNYHLFSLLMMDCTTSHNISPIMLELGSISTMQAWIDSGAYDEDADLRECREYLRVDEAQSKVIGNLQIYSANGDFVGYIPSSIDMKGIPTLTYENCYFAVEGAAHYPITSLFSSSYGCYGKATTSVPASTMGFLLIGDTGVTGRLIRSCEL